MKKRLYNRGYRHGQRNTPFSLLKSRNRHFVRGWGAGQGWLEKRIAP